MARLFTRAMVVPFVNDLHILGLLVERARRRTIVDLGASLFDNLYRIRRVGKEPTRRGIPGSFERRSRSMAPIR